mmetsp:Transcript_55019/g.164794  ORF Transcript_55019/g.164794 Transcript_55019/m.164794 type:complete len:302 (-) Transcript_55019:279-1184(-)
MKARDRSKVHPFKVLTPSRVHRGIRGVDARPSPRHLVLRGLLLGNLGRAAYPLRPALLGLLHSLQLLGPPGGALRDVRRISSARAGRLPLGNFRAEAGAERVDAGGVFSEGRGNHRGRGRGGWTAGGGFRSVFLLLVHVYDRLVPALLPALVVVVLLLLAIQPPLLLEGRLGPLGIELISPRGLVTRLARLLALLVLSLAVLGIVRLVPRRMARHVHLGGEHVDERVEEVIVGRQFAKEGVVRDGNFHSSFIVAGGGVRLPTGTATHDDASAVLDFRGRLCETLGSSAQCPDPLETKDTER